MYIRLFLFSLLLFVSQFVYAGICRAEEEDSIKQHLHELYTEFVDMGIRENYDSAYSLIQQCYAIDSTQAEIIFQRAVYEHMRIPKDSADVYLPGIIPEFEKAYAKDRDNRKYAKTLLSLYLSQDDTVKVCSILEDLTLLDHTNEQYVSWLVSIYEDLGEYEKELATINRLEQMVGASVQTELARVSAIWKQKGEKKAKRYWQSLVNKNPKEPEYYIYMGKKILRDGYPYTAAFQFNKALKLDPSNDEVRYLYIKCYEWHGKKEKAAKMAMDVINSPKYSSSLKVQLMRDLLEEYEAKPDGTQQMLDIFKQMLAYPQENDDMTQLYMAYLQTQNCTLDSIAEAMRDVLATEPTNSTAQNILLAYYSQKDSIDGIISVCRKAIKHNTELLEFHYYLAMAYYQQDKKDLSKQVLLNAVANKQFVKNTQIYSACYAILGQIYHNEDSIQKCYEAYEECLKWNPDDDETLNNYAYYLSVDGGDLVKAERMSKKSIEAQPNRGTYLDTYAWILFKLERYGEALVYINKALNNGGGGGVVYEHAGDIYALNGDIDAAMAYWELAKGQDEVSDKLDQKLAEKRYIPED